MPGKRSENGRTRTGQDLTIYVSSQQHNNLKRITKRKKKQKINNKKLPIKITLNSE